MKYTYEDHRAFFYIHKMIDRMKDEASDFDEDFSIWARRVSVLKREKTKKSNKQTAQEACKKISQLAVLPKKFKNALVATNLNYLSKLFHLTEAEKYILESCLLWNNNFLFRRLSSSILHSCELEKRDFSDFSGVSIEEISTLLKEDGRLMRYGLLGSFRSRECYSVTPSTRQLLYSKYKNCEEMKRAFLGTPMRGSWKAKDFEYIEETDFAVKLMQNASQNKGFNILLYGAPGTGKTSFAQMLAASVKRNLFTVGEESDGDIERNGRLQELYRKLSLLEKEDQHCLLFDEAEDVFSSKITVYSKVAMNRLLENNTCPVIWTTNHIRCMDPAFVRRFTLAICFEKPPVEVRQKIWAKHLKEQNLPHSSCQTLQLAKDFTVPPALISGAAKAAHMVKGDLDTVRNHIDIMMRALRGGRKEAEEVEAQTNFNPHLIHADMDLNQLTKRLKELGRLDFSLCLYGASGTGKSAYARHLAEELGLEYIQQRASDLISPYVGETEQNIAKAFAQAKEQKALLIFDEADSFLQDRSHARRSWEVTSVNEMLTWMESHPYPFICTTNLMDSLDPASLRRFSFKVKYDYLTPAQVQQAFKHFFGVSLSEDMAAELPSLTPGDFALVKSKADILGIKQAGKLKEMLAAEQDLKTNRGKNTIGFCA